MSSRAGIKGYVRTDVFITSYDEGSVNKLVSELKSRFNVVGVVRSSVVSELYYVSIEGDVVGEVREILKRYPEILWYKLDKVEFK
ncbi:MAG: hypothetical protein B6U73_04045 [Desulfurococcales archaeon ex4484_204]|nr:MAG: hypothetical protein B6U73_04045 [Desulfurococcales archaeon ex4484_204]